MTRLDAEYLEDTTFIDYNKAHYSKFMGYQLDNKKVIAKKLVKYNELYNQKGRKALILRTR